MSTWRLRWWQLVAAALLVALPVIGARVRQHGGPTCALDGLPVAGAGRVRVEEADGSSQLFCCVRCAELWLAHRGGRPRGVFVTDEASGQEIKAHDAVFVRSWVLTSAATGDRMHAFRGRADAESHARQCHGTILEGVERPFHAADNTPS